MLDSAAAASTFGCYGNFALQYLISSKSFISTWSCGVLCYFSSLLCRGRGSLRVGCANPIQGGSDGERKLRDALE